MPIPPKYIQTAAQRALDVRKTLPPSRRAGTSVGLARARDLARGADLSMRTIRRMHSYLSRTQQAYKDALAGDPVSAFGGVLISNSEIDLATAVEIHKLFCEVVIAPDFCSEALEILATKKNRILLKQKQIELPKRLIRTCLNGYLVQDKDSVTDSANLLEKATKLSPTNNEITDLIFASKICKHTKSNTIVLAKNKQLCASGTGQTSRVDALNQAINKAKSFGFDLKGAVMASDACFPFPDCVEIADNAGVKAVIQPGGSIKDQLSIDYCNQNNIAMVFTNTRHFKH